MDEALVLMAVIPCFFLWNTEYKALSIMLAADFVVFYALDVLWFASPIPGGVWMLPYKGCVYILFSIFYMFIRCRLALYLSGLSGFIGLIHCANPILLSSGTGITLENHEFIMGGYCVLQLVIFLWGVMNGLLHRNDSLDIWHSSNIHSSKGT